MTYTALALTTRARVALVLNLPEAESARALAIRARLAAVLFPD